MDKTTIASYYKSGFWKIGLVKMAVRKGIITKTQYTEITGKEYK